MSASCPAAETEILPTTVDAPLVIPIKGNYIADHTSGRVFITVDTTSLPWNPDKFRKSEYAAIIFNGEATAGRICPHISTRDRKRRISARDIREIYIETAVSTDELKAVNDAGCVITKRITYRSINWIPE